MNITLFKTPRFLVLYLLLQSEIPGRPYRRSANHAIRTNDTMHHSATGDAQLVIWYSSFRPPASVRDPACIRDPASIRTTDVWPPASDPACIWDPASIRGNTVTMFLLCNISELQQDIGRKSRIVTDPTSYFAPSFMGVTPLEFCWDLWQGVPELSYGIVCVILCLAILVQFLHVTNGQTNTWLQHIPS